LSAHKPHLRPWKKDMGAPVATRVAHSTPDSDDADEEKKPKYQPKAVMGVRRYEKFMSF